MHRPRASSVPSLSPLLLTIMLLAAAGSPGRAAAEEPLRAGSWAAEFELDPTLQYGLGYYGSATLAVKRHGSPTRALRFGVSVGFSETEEDGVAERSVYDPPYYPSPVSSEASVDGHRESHSYAPFAHFVHEWPVRDGMALFGEFGPSFRFSESNYHSEYVYGLSSPIRNTIDEVRVERSAALDVALGFEWFFSKRISLGARYGAFVAYRWGSGSSEQTSVELNGPGYMLDRDRSDLKGVDINSKRASVTLAAYF